MKLRRQRNQGEEAAAAPEAPAPVVVEGVRSAGPWDASERSPDGDPAYIDLGALLVRVRVGLDLQMPTDSEDGAVGSVVLVAENGGLELRAFAAPKSGGLWDEVRGDLVAEVERLKGEQETVDGPFGPELRVRVPVTLADGSAGFQPSRIVGIDGPRWMLRATFLGAAALEPPADDLLSRALRDVIVVRGDAPRMAREALLLKVPEGSTVHEP